MRVVPWWQAAEAQRWKRLHLERATFRSHRPQPAPAAPGRLPNMALVDCCWLCTSPSAFSIRVSRAFNSSDRIIERLHLSGKLIAFGSEGVTLILHAQLQAVDHDGHLVDRIRGLLHEIAEHTHAFVVGLLQARDGLPVAGEFQFVVEEGLC